MLRETLWPNETKAATRSFLISANSAELEGWRQLYAFENVDKGSADKRKIARSFPEIGSSI